MDLFKQDKKREEILAPLAERMRPVRAEDFIGQQEIFGEGKILRQVLQAQKVFSMILWGPPGSGKTTLAKLVSRQVQAQFYQVNAVAAGVKDIRKVIDQSQVNRRNGLRTILFIDEIHRFNKAQQDALLHAVEDGSVTLIGATTENPSFEVIAPLLSRCRVLKLHYLSEEELGQILDAALARDPVLREYRAEIDAETRAFLLGQVGGDARKLLNTLEICLQLSAVAAGEILQIRLPLVREALQQKHLLYDKKGDYHYDIISAFIKSIRGSDPDAGLYWLSVMLEGGEDPLFIARRLIILASEDVGNAAPLALNIMVSGYQAVHAIGMPEGAIVLAQMTTYLASLPKSNASYLGLQAALAEVRGGEAPDVPLHLRNAPTGLMKAMNYGKDYQYAHDHPGHFVQDNYFPRDVQPRAFYQPTEQGKELSIRNHLRVLWGSRYSSSGK